MDKGMDEAQRLRLERLAALDDDQIDTHDIPPAPEEYFALARRGAPRRPHPDATMVRLESDVLVGLRREFGDRDLQPEINRLLRIHLGAIRLTGSA